jgi:hypothetical protein
LLGLYPDLEDYLAKLKAHARANPTLAIRRLLTMAREYPREPFAAALVEASRYGLYDMVRIEKMILQRVRIDYFQLGDVHKENGHEGQG